MPSRNAVMRRVGGMSAGSGPRIPAGALTLCRCADAAGHHRLRSSAVARSRVAQLAERPAVNRQVIGSSPIAGAHRCQPSHLRERRKRGIPMAQSAPPLTKIPTKSPQLARGMAARPAARPKDGRPAGHARACSRLVSSRLVTRWVSRSRDSSRHQPAGSAGRRPPPSPRPVACEARGPPVRAIPSASGRPPRCAGLRRSPGRPADAALGLVHQEALGPGTAVACVPTRRPEARLLRRTPLGRGAACAGRRRCVI